MQRFGERLGLVCRNRDLVAVLAGIAGARDVAVDAGDGQRAHVHEAHSGRFGHERREHGLGLRALQRDQRTVVVKHDVAGRRKPGLKMGKIVGLAGCIDHEHEVVAAIGDHEVVEDAAPVVRQERIALASRLQSEDVDGNQRLQRQRGVLDPAALGPHGDLAHMRDVEQPGRLPGMQMLLDDAAVVLQRHRISGEGHHPRAVALMPCGERRGPESLRDRSSAASSCCGVRRTRGFVAKVQDPLQTPLCPFA